MSGVVGDVKLAAEALQKAHDKYVDDYLVPISVAQIALGGIVGAFGIIRQAEIAGDYLDLARDQVAQSDRLVALSERNYNEISVRTFDCQKAEFERYTGDLSPRENEYLLEAFRFKKFVPDFVTQEGRAIANVSSLFDRAQRNRDRARGKYSTGRACHDATMFAIERAKALTVAAESGYRYEEQRESRQDAIYFDRLTRGAGLTVDVGNRMASALNGGASVANSGFAQVTGAFQQRTGAFAFVSDAISDRGDIFGSIANFGLGNVGRGAGNLLTGGIFQNGGTNVMAQTAAFSPNAGAQGPSSGLLNLGGLNFPGASEARVVGGNSVP